MIHGCDQTKSRFSISSKSRLQLSGFSPQRVNGLYRIREERVNNRDSWISSRGMVLWYNKRNSWWMVGPKSKVGTDKCYVYCFGTADDPTRVTSRWKYFDSKAVGESKFREEPFASVVRADTKSIRRRAPMASGPGVPRGGHRRIQSFAVHDQSLGYGHGDLNNGYRKWPQKKERTYSQARSNRREYPLIEDQVPKLVEDFSGVDLYSYSPGRQKGRPDYDDAFRRRPSSSLRTIIPHTQKSISRTNRMGRSGRHHRRISIDNSSDRTISTLHPTTPRSLSGKFPGRSSRARRRSPIDRGSISTHSHRILKRNRRHQQDGFSMQQQQLSMAPKESPHHKRLHSRLDFSAPAGTIVSPANSVRKAKPYRPSFRLKEYVGLKAKHEGGIFVTKYPFRSKLFSWPKKIRLEIGFVDDADGERRPVVKWNDKWVHFDDIRKVTIGIKSSTFHRFENQIMRKKAVQPNHCLSVHSEYRTLDVVLKSADDAQDLKRYLEINLKHPLMLLQE